MSKSLTKCELELKLHVTLANILDQVTIQDDLQAGVSTGTGGVKLAKLLAELADGTGAGKANKFFHNRYTFAANGNTDIDLQTQTADAFGAAQAFTLIKIFLLRIVTPATGLLLKVMPTAVNGFNALSSGGVTDGVPCHNKLYADSLIDGFVVDGSHKVLRVNNPHATIAIPADLIIIGQ